MVTNFNPTDYTVDVKLDNVACIPSVPILGTYGPGFGRDMTMLTSYRGAQVVLLQVMGKYYVLGTLPEKASSESVKTSQPVSGDGFAGEDTSTYGKTQYAGYSAGRPTDILSGDKILSTDGGSMLALYREGMVRLKSSPLAQFILFKYKELARIISRRFQLYTDFGELEFFSDGSGYTGFSLQGGAHLTAESHPTANKPTLQVWGGACPGGGEVRLQAKVSTPDGSYFSETKASTDGSVSTESTKGVTGVYAGKEELSFFDGGVRTYVGDVHLMVIGDYTVLVSGKTTFISSEEFELKTPELNVKSDKITLSAGSKIVLDSPKVETTGLLAPTACTKP